MMPPAIKLIISLLDCDRSLPFFLIPAVGGFERSTFQGFALALIAAMAASIFLLQTFLVALEP